MILNARKVQIYNEDDEALQQQADDKKDQGVTESTNLVFELINTDLVGRSILHRASFEHKSKDI
jgi:hypothetical protein